MAAARIDCRNNRSLLKLIDRTLLSTGEILTTAALLQHGFSADQIYRLERDGMLWWSGGCWVLTAKGRELARPKETV